MAWLQENYIIAVVGLVIAVFLFWWLFGRSKATTIAPPTADPAKPAKPLAPVKPDIIAAEPARFKPIAPKPQPPAPAPQPVAKAPIAPEPAPVPLPTAEPAPPAPKPAAKPKVTAKPAAKKAPVKAQAEKSSAKPVAKVAPKTAAKKAKTASSSTEPNPVLPTPTTSPTAPSPASAPATTADNLQLLKGVGPKLVVLLGGLGVTRFQQVADWTDTDIAAIDAQLGAFQGRIVRDNLVDQAGYLARGDKAGFEAKYGALGGEL